jgi:peptide/nickel transport system substrate-binding protein
MHDLIKGEESMAKTKMDRRHFLRFSAMTAAGAAVAACSPATPQIIKETVEVEKVVKETVEVEKVVKETVVVEKEKVVKETVEVEKLSMRQSPDLQALVQSGDLSPLEERMALEPMVLPAVEEVGTYGGDVRFLNVGESHSAWEYQYLLENPCRWNADATEIQPNLATGFEFSADGMSCTIYLRKGIKWSDGEPFTADTFDFWWNDLVLQEDAGYTEPYWTITAEQSMMLEKLDDFSFKVTFHTPNWLFWNKLGSSGDYLRMYAPPHYLKPFHPEYNSDVADYTQLVEKFPPSENLYIDPALPVVTPWRTTEYSPGQRLVADRNPYYWKIDPEGKQVPYTDTWIMSQVEDPRVVPLRIVGGEVDFLARSIPFDSFTTLKTSEEQGNYRLIQWSVGAGGDPMIVPNWDHSDPVMRDLIRNRSFRLGISHAIDRQTINDVVYFGQGAPSQGVTSPYSPWGRTTPEGEDLMEQWRTLAAEYDPDRANDYLDEAGLDARDQEGWRLRPDGKRLSIIIITGSSPDSRAVDVLEFVTENWKAVGIETTLNSMDWSAFGPRFDAGEYDVFGWDAWTGYYIPTIPDTLFPVGAPYWGTPLTNQWFNTKGEEGVQPEPGGPMARLQEIYANLQAAKTEAEQNQFVLEGVRVHVEEGPFMIAAVNDIPNLVVARPNLRNIPDFAFTGSWAQGAPGCTNPPMYFYKE